jgi:hypothetical protein
MLYVILTDDRTFDTAREALAYYESLPQTPAPRIEAGVFRDALTLAELREDADAEAREATFRGDPSPRP